MMFNLLDVQDAAKLEEPFLREEVLAALSDLKKDKAPRLKKVVTKVVSKFQNAFVESRQILDVDNEEKGGRSNLHFLCKECTIEDKGIWAFELHKNLAGRNKIGFETFDKAKKKDFTENKPDDDKDHALESTKEGEKSTELREDINL
ncbi:hypothetical protein CK203_004913 [Vitis vinifera]|uniref:Uncharacterized protein n=1 Tax=Vitis vinifera TaxID=29760 RepID=A0A438KGE6_VITVI|nr:hypothetical protein CK203_004913 [Vitis vinifera]